MVAETLPLPNLRKMFIPDEGFVMCECDLVQADAQVVAWEADDDTLKQIFRERLDVHTENAKSIFRTSTVTYEQRQKAKAGVHAANYGVSARTLAITLGITVKEADDFLHHWFSAHPGIREWHNRVLLDLKTHRAVYNPFGFRMYYFDRIESAFKEALAWVPQSTVALVIDHAWVQLEDAVPEAQVLLHGHDSLLFQLPTDLCQQLLPAAYNAMHVTIPYDDPLTIPVDINVSEKSWGDVAPVEELYGKTIAELDRGVSEAHGTH